MPSIKNAFRATHGTRHALHEDGEQPSFYNLLQESPGALKHRIRSLHGPANRRRVAAALVVRAGLIMVFAIAFINAFRAAFGDQASAPAVAFFVMLLCLRFVGFNYRFADNIAALAVVCAVLTVAPLAAMSAQPAVRLVIHLIALLVIFVVGADDARYGNGGTYGFIYTYLAGMLVADPLPPVQVPARVATMAAGFAVCALVHARSRRRIMSTDRRLIDALRDIDLHSTRTRYQVRAALGISLSIFIAELLGFERTMWVGIVASSMLTPHGFKVADRMGWRVGFTFVGVCVFTLVFPSLPPALAAVFPLVGGMGNGISATYQWQQVFNTMGALLVGSAALGSVGAAAFWRMADTLFAVIAAFALSAVMSLVATRGFKLGVPLYEEQIALPCKNRSRICNLLQRGSLLK